MENKIPYGKLKGLMTEKGYSIKSLSEATNIPLSTLSNKLSALTEFKASEIFVIAETLEIKNIKEYFFN